MIPARHIALPAFLFVLLATGCNIMVTSIDRHVKNVTHFRKRA